MEFASKIFIDGGDPEETRQADKLLKAHGHPGVQGQTTNPSLIVKRLMTSIQQSAVSDQLKKVSEKEAFEFYRKTVVEMAKVTKGPISIQVIGDPATLTADAMLSQARDRITWIPNGVIKFPCTAEGLTAAEIFCQEGPVNITLNFSQEQAAAVYGATKRHNYDVFVSPFVGRLDDKGEKGMDVVANIIQMYRASNRFPELKEPQFRESQDVPKVLTASVRTLAHILYALWLKSDAITIPFKVFKEWNDAGFPTPSADYFYDAPGLTEIPYNELSLDVDWKDYNLAHDLTTSGLAKFWEDWAKIVVKSESELKADSHE